MKFENSQIVSFQITINNCHYDKSSCLIDLKASKVELFVEK